MKGKYDDLNKSINTRKCRWCKKLMTVSWAINFDTVYGHCPEFCCVACEDDYHFNFGRNFVCGLIAFVIAVLLLGYLYS